MYNMELWFKIFIKYKIDILTDESDEITKEIFETCNIALEMKKFKYLYTNHRDNLIIDTVNKIIDDM
jgi:hypothetical protein